MFEKIKIENFRGIKNLSIENLSNVNLFFGKNNSGKSTVLESVFLLSGMTNPHLLVLCNSIRGFKGIQDFSLFFHNFDTMNPISIVSEGDSNLFNRQLKMELSASQEYTRNFNDKDIMKSIDNAPFQTLTVSAVNDNKKYRNEFILDFPTEIEERGRIGIINSYKEELVCKYIAPIDTGFALNEVNDILKDKQEKNIIENLSLIDDRIIDFIVNQNTIMVDIGLQSRIPLNMMGDGTRKFFNLIVSLYRCRNGILLIDEIDNGLHFSVMKNLWKLILSLSKKYNVQIFATTHNIDLLKGLDDFLNEFHNDANAVSLYKVVHKKNDEEKALFYPHTDFSAVLANGNEVR